MNDILFGIHIEQVIKDCYKSEFPGTIKWPANNPIWDCYIGRTGISPKAAWNNLSYVQKAVKNLYYITQKSINENKYPRFVKTIHEAFIDAYEQGNYLKLRQEVIKRFTVAKIAPKVTALKPSDFTRILKQANIDISNGIYCPMAGFGGIIEGAKRWFKEHNLPEKIEAYDINETLCNFYGWTKRDLLAQKITTDKVVFACPPFGPNTERWPGTPDNMYYEFDDWCKLIKEYIKAPNYILVGPEIRQTSKYKNGKKISGLFIQKYGIMYYPKYSN